MYVFLSIHRQMKTILCFSKLIQDSSFVAHLTFLHEITIGDVNFSKCNQTLRYLRFKN